MAGQRRPGPASVNTGPSDCGSAEEFGETQLVGRVQRNCCLGTTSESRVRDWIGALRVSTVGGQRTGPIVS